MKKILGKHLKQALIVFYFILKHVLDFFVEIVTIIKAIIACLLVISAM